MFQATVGGLKVKGSIFLLFSVFWNVHLPVILVLRVICTTGIYAHACKNSFALATGTWYQVPCHTYLPGMKHLVVGTTSSSVGPTCYQYGMQAKHMF